MRWGTPFLLGGVGILTLALFAFSLLDSAPSVGEGGAPTPFSLGKIRISVILSPVATPENHGEGSNSPVPTPPSEDLLDFTSQKCAQNINNYTNFCPASETEGYLRTIRKEYEQLFRIPRERVYQALAGRVIFIAGDSLAGQHFVSLNCILTRSDEEMVNQIGPTWAWRIPRLIENPLRCSVISTFTICYLKSGMKAENSPWMADVLAVAKRTFNERDILVLNHGLHFSPRDDVPDEYPSRVRALRMEWNCSRPSFSVYFRETSAQHFQTTRGGWFPGRNSNWKTLRTRAITQNYSCFPQLNSDEEMSRNGYVNGSLVASPNKLNLHSSGMYKRDGIRILHAWNVSSKYWQLHSSYTKLDCTHYCVPGVPDVWSLGLLKDILSRHETNSRAEALSDIMHTRDKAMSRKRVIESLKSLLYNVSAARTEAGKRGFPNQCSIDKHFTRWQMERQNGSDATSLLWQKYHPRKSR